MNVYIRALHDRRLLCYVRRPFVPEDQQLDSLIKAVTQVHTLLELRGSIPIFVHLSDDKLLKGNVLDLLIRQTGAFYVMDWGGDTPTSIISMPCNRREGPSSSGQSRISMPDGFTRRRPSARPVCAAIRPSRSTILRGQRLPGTSAAHPLQGREWQAAGLRAVSATLAGGAFLQMG